MSHEVPDHALACLHLSCLCDAVSVSLDVLCRSSGLSVASSKLSASEAANNDRLLESLSEVRQPLKVNFVALTGYGLAVCKSTYHTCFTSSIAAVFSLVSQLRLLGIE